MLRKLLLFLFPVLKLYLLQQLAIFGIDFPGALFMVFFVLALDHQLAVIVVFPVIAMPETVL